MLVSTFLLVACSEDSGDNTSSTGTTAAGETTGGFSRADATKWALDFTGGTAGKAKGQPYRIGFVNSSDFFPEGDVGANAALRFINEELGGVSGRPLQLVRCKVSAPPDGAACGARLANDDSIDLVLSGLVLAGNADLYAALKGKATALMAAPLDATDYVSANAVAYGTGALGAGMGGAEFVADEFHPKTNSLVVTDDVAGRGGASVLRPIIEAKGIQLNLVFVPPTATVPEIASALQAAKAQSTDIISLGLFEQGCIAAYDALKSLGYTQTVVTTGVCAGNAMQEHLAGLGEKYRWPDWYFVGAPPYIPDPPDDLATYLAKIEQYGGKDVLGSTGTPIAFAGLMNVAKILNQVGVDKATYETLDAAVRGFKGPAMLQPGPISCGHPPYQSICANEVTVARFAKGKWESVRGGSKNNAVDITQYLRPNG